MQQAAESQAMAASKPRMRKIGPSLYLVESSSSPGIGHKVDVLRLKCGCKAGQHGRRCHHLVWAIQMDSWYRTQQALMANERARVATAGAAPQIARPSGMGALLEAFL